MQEESGCWRGDPCRQVTLFDSPGLCSAEPGLYGTDKMAACTDRDILRAVLNLVKDLRQDESWSIQWILFEQQSNKYS